MRRTVRKSTRRNAVRPCQTSSESVQKTMKISSDPLIEHSFLTEKVHSSSDISMTKCACKRLRKGKVKDYTMKNLRTDVSYEEAHRNLDYPPNLPDRTCDCSSSDSSSSLQKKFHKEDAKQEKNVSAVLYSSRTKFGLRNSSPRLPKVKTTRQLVEELKARKDPHDQFLNFSDFRDGSQNFSLSALQSRRASSAKILRSKSELMQKFLSSIPESSPESDSQSLSVNRVSPPIASNEYSAVSDKNLPVPITDFKTEENLPSAQSIDLGQIDWYDDQELPVVKRDITDEDVDRYSQQWEFVNGTYSCDGFFKPWQECTESKIFPEETIQILPYVNID